jgi:hypothetical protein
MIFREMSQKIETAPRVAAEEAKSAKTSTKTATKRLWTARMRCTWLHRARQERCPSATCPLRLRNPTRRATFPRPTR